MPITSCTINGKEGYKWGSQGKCYTGPDAKKKALAQGKAIGDYFDNLPINKYKTQEEAEQATDKRRGKLWTIVNQETGETYFEWR